MLCTRDIEKVIGVWAALLKLLSFRPSSPFHRYVMKFWYIIRVHMPSSFDRKRHKSTGKLMSHSQPCKATDLRPTSPYFCANMWLLFGMICRWHTCGSFQSNRTCQHAPRERHTKMRGIALLTLFGFPSCPTFSFHHERHVILNAPMESAWRFLIRMGLFFQKSYLENSNFWNIGLRSKFTNLYWKYSTEL